MTSSNIQASLPPTCNVVIPGAGASLESMLSRWSDSCLSLPYATVTPTTTDDIIAIIAYATSHNLKIIPANGRHACFVPVTPRTIYVSMRNFDSIELDTTKGEVALGGGCLAGDVLRSLAAQGWYTCVPNSNAVGMIGALTGGLNHGLVGRHGMGIDCLESITFIPFSTPDGSKINERTIGTSSSGEDRRLFNAMRGAGPGLGIITSATIKAWPVAELGLTDGGIWSRGLMFPPAAIDVAVRTFLSLFPVNPQMSPVLVFLRAPPNAPSPGAPLILLAIRHYGPKEEAERLCARTFDDDVVSRTISAVTSATTFGTLNDIFDGLNAHGGYKDNHTAILQEIDEDCITKSFQLWLNFSEKNKPSRVGSSLLVANIVCKPLESTKDETFYAARDRRIVTQITPWYADLAEREEADAFGREGLEILREKDEKAGRKRYGFANNLTINQDMGEIYSKEQLDELNWLKKTWDPRSVGWTPAVDGW